ncbi:MAG: glycan-binding surface protein [Candidatus Omnitrophica bacterium]|nr:glycan-binding surface protein [Candidatus Omnitrophota bacterium]
MKKIMAMVVAVALLGLFSALASAEGEEKVLFNFEKDTQGWEVPEWALEQQDYVGKTVASSADFAKNGTKSLKLTANFPGKVWTAAIVEDFEYFDWSPYKEVSCDVYIPQDSPSGLKGKLILTVGESWKFTEMARSIPLVPGEWVTISANLMPGSEDWKRTVVDDNFRKDVRKIAIRVESNRNPVYDGPIYIDNVKVIK